MTSPAKPDARPRPGRIVRSGGKDLALELEAKGYEWVDSAAEALA